MAFQAGAIVSQMTLDKSKFSAGMKVVQKQTRTLTGWVRKNSGQFKAMGLAATAAGAAVLLAFKKMVKQYVETGDMIHKMSIRTGFAAETLSELAYAADISGADLSTLEKGVKRMARTITDAGEGLESYLRPLRRIGLEVEDLRRMSPEKQFLAISGAIAKLEDPTLRAATAQEIFGRAGTALLPLMAEGAEGMARLREEAHRLGIIFDEEAAAKAAALKDAQTALKGSIQGLSIAILTDLIPVITDVVKQFTDWFVDTRKNAATWARSLIGFFKVVAQGIEGLLLAWGAFKIFVFKLGEEIVRHLARLTMGIVIVTGYTKKMGVLAKTHEAAKTALKDLVTIGMGYNNEADKQIEKVAGLIDGFDNFFKTLDSVSERLNAVKKGTKDLTPPIENLRTELARPLSLGPLAVDIPKMSLKDFEEWYKKWLAKLLKDWPKTWAESFRKTIGEAALFTSSLGSLFNQMTENQIANIEHQYDTRKKAIENSLLSEEEKGKAMERLDKQFEKKRKKAMRTQAKRTKAVGIMESIIHTASAVVEALPNIPLSIAVGIMGAIQTALIAAQPLPALQRGGEIGAAGIVGEAGPELFFPRTPGMIVPVRTEATPFPPQAAITIKIMGSLVSTTGVARADLEKAGNALLDIIESQARRRGYTLNG